MVSNAGILNPTPQTVLELDISLYERLFAVNARGMALCVKHAARAMVEKRVRGSIICTASVTASNGIMRATDYSMSKHAVLGLIRSASVQLGTYGIRVNCVSPNTLVTPLTLNATGESKEKLQEAYSQMARLKGVILTPRLVANTMLFLASDDSAFVSGLNLSVDGVYISGTSDML